MDSSEFPVRADNSTATLVDPYGVVIPPSLNRSPLLGLLYMVGVTTWRNLKLFLAMAEYVLDAAKEHIQPLYVATCALQLLRPEHMAAVVSFTARSFIFLSLGSFGIHSIRNRVAALPPPSARHHPPPQDPQQPTDAAITADATAPSGDSAAAEAAAAAPEPADAAPYAVVTGASSGIGRAIAQELADRGWDLVLVGRSKDALREHAKVLRREAKERGHKLKVHVVAADLSVDAAPDAVYEEVRNVFDAGPPEILVNSAGVAWDCEFADLPEEHLQNQLMVNVVATTRLTQLFAKDMRRRRAGRIMIVSSITAAMPNPKVAVYAATKSYLASLSQALAVEMEPHGVAVTCLMPGATRTAFEQNANAVGAKCFKDPRLVQTAQQVAHAGVEGMLRGDAVVVSGEANRAVVHWLEPILPRKLAMLLVQSFF